MHSRLKQLGWDPSLGRAEPEPGHWVWLVWVGLGDSAYVWPLYAYLAPACVFGPRHCWHSVIAMRGLLPQGHK